MITTRLTELLGIRHPVLQGAMAMVSSEAGLAAAVSNGGGLGIVASGMLPPDQVEEIIREIRTLTDKPFGVNVMMRGRYVREISELCARERVPVIGTGAGNPEPYMEMWKQAGCKVIPVVSSPRQAKKMESLGADAVVAEGMEAGGYIGEMTTMALIPQCADQVRIPLIAAGGISDARGVAAAFALGADGVQLGTLFLAADECRIHEEYKNEILKAGAEGNPETLVIGGISGSPIRVLRSKYAQDLARRERNGASAEEVEQTLFQAAQNAVVHGSVNSGVFIAGQSAALVRERKPAAGLVESLMRETQNYISGMLAERGVTIG